MTDRPITGHDGPYDAPVRIDGGRVLPDWIDYNGHMNVAYYTMAFDEALDAFLEDHLGLGETQVVATKTGPYALQSQVSYTAELLEGAAFYVTVQLLDFDAKRMHLYCQMHRATDDGLAATLESLIMNVDHRVKRGAPYPAWAQARLQTMADAHADLVRAPIIGAPIGIRRS